MEKKKLTPDEVQYISFEGGGGKGNTFIGAIEALEERNVIRFKDMKLTNVKGISGASAGAITAMLLSCGYDSKYMKTLVKENKYDFKKFIERPTSQSVGLMPRIGGKYQKDKMRYRRYHEYRAIPDEITAKLLKSQTASLLIALGANLVWSLFEPYEKKVSSRIIKIKQKINSPFVKELAKNIADYPWGYLACLGSDWGLFSGQSARNFFESMIRYPMSIAGQTLSKNLVTFEEHFNFYRINLAISGSNFSTGKSHIFSRHTTPNFPVSDAVRISMSFPFIFKPVVITLDDIKNLPKSKKTMKIPNEELEGLWVDGGYYNNLPMNVFKDLDHTLGIRLGLDRPNKIDSFLSYITTYLSLSLFGAGESRLSDSYFPKDQLITLNPYGLGLLDFEPKAKDLEFAINKARESVLNYFT